LENIIIRIYHINAHSVNIQFHKNLRAGDFKTNCSFETKLPIMLLLFEFFFFQCIFNRKLRDLVRPLNFIQPSYNFAGFISMSKRNLKLVWQLYLITFIFWDTLVYRDDCRFIYLLQLLYYHITSSYILHMHIIVIVLFRGCIQIFSKRKWKNLDEKVHFESGVCLGIGTFNLVSVLNLNCIKLLWSNHNQLRTSPMMLNKFSVMSDGTNLVIKTWSL